MMKKKIKNFFKSGHERSIKAKKNIVATFFIKGSSVLIGFFSIRIILDYLGKEQYGIWIVITSFLMWYTFFGLGLGNGLRNKLAETIANKDYIKGKEYVSTAYFLTSIIAVSFFSIFLILNRYINWNKILNTNAVPLLELQLLTNIVFGLFFVQFVLEILSKILYADQKPALANVFNPIINLLRLLFILWLRKFHQEDIIYLGLIFSLTPILVYFIGSILLFKFLYHKIKPSIRHLNLKLSKNLLNLGLGFFIIGIGNLFILQLGNLLIAQFFGPEEVTVYNVAFKLFSIPTMIITIITTPLWSAYTEAWIKNDIQWIKRSVKKMRYIIIYLYMSMLVLLLFYQDIINIWIKDDLLVPFSLALALFINSFYGDLGRIHLQFTNGISKLRIQLITTLIGAILIIPLSYYFCVFLDFGLWGITLAIMISNFKYFFAFIQYKKIMNKTANGIWYK